MKTTIQKFGGGQKDRQLFGVRQQTKTRRKAAADQSDVQAVIDNSPYMRHMHRNQETAHQSPGVREAARRQTMANHSSQVQMMQQRQAQASASIRANGLISGEQQRRANQTHLPDNLKSGAERLSGLSLDDVRVHYNSSKPAQLNALAYTQGNEIHVAPGQEKHLSHETWHIVQQKQGRVQPTQQFHDVSLNDEDHLEQEADAMGNRASRMGQAHATLSHETEQSVGFSKHVQNDSVVQRVRGFGRKYKRLEEETDEEERQGAEEGILSTLKAQAKAGVKTVKHAGNRAADVKSRVFSGQNVTTDIARSGEEFQAFAYDEDPDFGRGQHSSGRKLLGGVIKKGVGKLGEAAIDVRKFRAVGEVKDRLEQLEASSFQDDTLGAQDLEEVLSLARNLKGDLKRQVAIQGAHGVVNQATSQAVGAISPVPGSGSAVNKLVDIGIEESGIKEKLQTLGASEKLSRDEFAQKLSLMANQENTSQYVHWLINAVIQEDSKAEEYFLRAKEGDKSIGHILWDRSHTGKEEAKRDIAKRRKATANN